MDQYNPKYKYLFEFVEVDHDNIYNIIVQQLQRYFYNLD